VPVERGREHPLQQNLRGGVLALLEFVADDGHFRLQVFALHEAVDHPVGFQAEGEFQVVVAGRQRLVIISAVMRSGAVEIRPARLQQPGDVGVRRRAFEEHVLEQVGHARFAVAFVPRPDENGEVHGDRRFRRIGKQQNLKAVVETVLGDSLDAGDFFRCCRLGGRGHGKQLEPERGRCHCGNREKQSPGTTWNPPSSRQHFYSLEERDLRQSRNIRTSVPKPQS